MTRLPLAPAAADDVGAPVPLAGGGTVGAEPTVDAEGGVKPGPQPGHSAQNNALAKAAQHDQPTDFAR